MRGLPLGSSAPKGASIWYLGPEIQGLGSMVGRLEALFTGLS